METEEEENFFAFFLVATMPTRNTYTSKGGVGARTSMLLFSRRLTNTENAIFQCAKHLIIIQSTYIGIFLDMIKHAHVTRVLRLTTARATATYATPQSTYLLVYCIYSRSLSSNFVNPPYTKYSNTLKCSSLHLYAMRPSPYIPILA